jgi:PKD repeat protein
MSRVRQCAAAVAGALVVSAASAVPSVAAPTWRPSTVLDGALTSSSADIAVDATGRSTAVWTRPVEGHQVVEASTRPGGGQWSPPVSLSDPATDAVNPRVAVDDTGGAVVAWSESPAGVIHASTRGADGVWSAPQTLGAEDLDSPLRVVVDPAGNATVAWRVSITGWSTVVVAARPAGGAWTSPVPLSATGGQAVDLDLAVDGSGRVTVLWNRVGGGHAPAQVRQSLPGGAWSPTVDISAPTVSAYRPVLGVAPGGSLVAAWGRLDTSGFRVLQVSEQQTPGSDWTSPVDLSTTSSNALEARVAVDDTGRATAVWRQDTTPSQVLAAERLSPQTWTPPVVLSHPADAAVAPVVVRDATGAATAAWQLTTPDGVVVQASRQPPGGAWGAATRLSAPGEAAVAPLLSAEPDGDVAALWRDVATPSAIRLLVAGLDVAGPVLSAFTAPATGTAGQAMSFAATASDHWSAIASYAWSFGDGGTASGAAVSHTYAAAGTYPVTLSITDEVGNSTMRTATAVVAVAVPVIETFKLTRRTIQVTGRNSEGHGAQLDHMVATRTKLKVRLNTSAVVKLVIKSKHPHLIQGQRKRIRVVLRKQLSAGVSRITIKAKVKGVKLRPDTYVISGTAKNVSGKSPRKKTELKVVR